MNYGDGWYGGVYMGAMYVHAEFEIKDMIVPLVIGAIVTVVNLALEKPTKQKYGKFFAIVTVYCLVLGTMLGTAFWGFIKTQQISYLVYTIGAALFLLSDVILSPMYFAIAQDKNTPVNFVLNHATYYIGQFMIALSVFLLVPNA